MVLNNAMIYYLQDFCFLSILNANTNIKCNLNTARTEKQ